MTTPHEYIPDGPVETAPCLGYERQRSGTPRSPPF